MTFQGINMLDLFQEIVTDLWKRNKNKWRFEKEALDNFLMQIKGEKAEQVPPAEILPDTVRIITLENVISILTSPRIVDVKTIKRKLGGQTPQIKQLLNDMCATNILEKHHSTYETTYYTLKEN